MLLNHRALLKTYNRLFHISEEPDIKIFVPRPSPSHFEGLTENVVFAITNQMVHNYLLPRDCPRVTYYTDPQTTIADKDKFIGLSAAAHIIVVESGWYQQIRDAKLYCYEFLTDSFSLLDECAGYYISLQEVVPIAINQVDDIMSALLRHNVELRFTPSLIKLAGAVSKSSLNFSLIRMRNAKKD